MRKTYLHMKTDEFKARFSKFTQHKKKVKALENLSSVGQFKHVNYLGLIKDCLDTGFLEDQEEKFLEWMLQKYEINYLDWSHRTRWLKQQMSELSRKSAKPNRQMYFNFNNQTKQQNPKVPIELLIQQQQSRGSMVRSY